MGSGQGQELLAPEQGLVPLHSVSPLFPALMWQNLLVCVYGGNEHQLWVRHFHIFYFILE